MWLKGLSCGTVGKGREIVGRHSLFTTSSAVNCTLLHIHDDTEPLFNFFFFRIS